MGGWGDHAKVGGGAELPEGPSRDEDVYREEFKDRVADQCETVSGTGMAGQQGCVRWAGVSRLWGGQGPAPLLFSTPCRGLPRSVTWRK